MELWPKMRAFTGLKGHTRWVEQYQYFDNLYQASMPSLTPYHDEDVPSDLKRLVGVNRKPSLGSSCMGERGMHHLIIPLRFNLPDGTRTELPQF
ncbi:hypothetical protein PG990_010548 [Apiospora arundinis]